MTTNINKLKILTSYTVRFLLMRKSEIKAVVEQLRGYKNKEIRRVWVRKEKKPVEGKTKGNVCWKRDTGETGGAKHKTARRKEPGGVARRVRCVKPEPVEDKTS